jgi:hydroxyacylglutathione hydrolase
MGQVEASMIIEMRDVPPFGKNGFVVGCEKSREGILIDPGDEVEDLLEAVQAHRLTIKYILLTHAHLDHITGVARAKEGTNAPIFLHRDDLFLYDGIVQQGAMFGIPVERQPPVDVFYEGPAPLKFGEFSVWVHHTPGHCPGGVCLAVGKDGAKERTLFVGDTLFAGSIGRTDGLPRTDLPTLLHSIKTVLFSFPDDSVVYSGHGPSTTIGRERRTNPFLR